MIGTIADYLVRTIGIILITTGPLWFINPVRSVLTFGLPRTNTDMSTFGPALGGRNIAVGFMFLLSSLYSTRQLTGIMLCLYATGAGWSDTMVCLAHGQGHRIHVFNICVCYVVAGCLVWS
ncbi:DUF4267 domain-containing protein [Aspergillus stella-maris]|uniref:DUF4267 domain-containing protein n=1 Tax=Aspergillus stella-maris TaxID=1810926 RepID=UPI003CCD770D